MTTADKEGENSTFDKELVDAEVIITTPYVSVLIFPASPAPLTGSRMSRISNMLSYEGG